LAREHFRRKSKDGRLHCAACDWTRPAFSLAHEIIEAGLLDDLCLTLSPVLAGPGAGRIVADLGPLREPGGVDGRRLSLAHVLADDGHLLCRYVRPAG
jgi:riboflavin biosynthesis pyrimidine reductase